MAAHPYMRTARTDSTGTGSTENAHPVRNMPMQPSTTSAIIDRRIVRQRRKRSARHFPAHDFLHRRAMTDIVDRLETVNRRFPRAVFCGTGNLVSLLTPACAIGDIILMDCTEHRLPRDTAPCFAGEEESLPLAPGSLDLFISLLTLHGANDFTGALARIGKALKPDGLFIGALAGENTLAALKRAYHTAESRLAGGIGTRFVPCITLQDAGNALAQAGFSMPVADMDRVCVQYRDPHGIIRDLRGTGETCALYRNRTPLRRDVHALATELFREAGGHETFDIIHLTGWAPHESQQKPLRPGSARASLAAAVQKAARPCGHKE